jgi:hypothetical protein
MERKSRLHASLLAAVVVFAVGGLTASPALDQAVDDRAATPEETIRITEVLTAKGYSHVHDIEVDDGRFEVDARHPDGHEVDLELDLETLEILFEDRD